jgi:DNA-binding NarL/FixJ family response regulator
MARALVRSHVRETGRGVDFSVALAALEAHEGDPVGARLREADRRVRVADDEGVRAAAAAEALKLRLVQLEALAEMAAWNSPAQIALALAAWARASGQSSGPFDELIAAIRAAAEPVEKEAA